MIRRLVSLLAVGLLVAACSETADAPAPASGASEATSQSTPAIDADWISIAYPGSGFVAKFPGPPKMTKAKVVYMIDGGLTEGVEWNDPEDGVVYSAGFSQWGSIVPGVEDSSALYRTFTAGYQTRAPDPNRLESQKAIDANGREGMEYVWVGADDTRFRMWVFVIGNRGYAAVVTFPAKLQYSMAPLMDTFLADFYLI